MRQPMSSRKSWPCAVIGMKTAEPSVVPKPTPTMVHPVYSARLSFGACSAVSALAPACSPPADRPWARRRTTSMIGAKMPAFSAVGSKPMSVVATAMRIKV